MLATFLLLAAISSDTSNIVGGLGYRTIISDRTKPVKSAPTGYPHTWRERVQVVVGKDAKDAEFSRFMRRAAVTAEHDFDEEGEKCQSFDTCDAAGSLEVSEHLIAASPDVISVSIETSFYEAGMPHPNSAGIHNFIWSRRLNRLLREDDLFARRPDRALRRLAQRNFDNRDSMQNPDDPNGLVLRWDRASVGPNGITWFFGPYELGGYPSAGKAMIRWSALKPYLRRKLPFASNRIRSAPAR